MSDVERSRDDSHLERAVTIEWFKQNLPRVIACRPSQDGKSYEVYVLGQRMGTDQGITAEELAIARLVGTESMGASLISVQLDIGEKAHVTYQLESLTVDNALGIEVAALLGKRQATWRELDRKYLVTEGRKPVDYFDVGQIVGRAIIGIFFSADDPEAI